MKAVQILRNVLMVLGLMLIIAGVAKASLAAGMIIAGLILFLGGRG